MNQTPEQLARDKIDSELVRSGWLIQSKSKTNLNAGIGVAVREYQTDIGPADYVLFVDKKPVGIIEAKRAEEGVHLTMHEGQNEGYASAKLKYLNNKSLADLDNLPDPDELALDIVENLEAGLESFKAIIASLNNKQ